MTREGEAEFSNVFTGVSAIGRSTNFTADGQILDVRSLLAKNGEASPGGALLRLAPGSAQRRRGFLCRRLASAGRPALSSAPCGSCGSWTRSCPSALWLVQFVCGVLCPRLHLLLHFLAGAVCRIGERPNRGGTSLVHDEWAQSHCPLSACLLALTTLSYGCFGSFPIRC